MSRWTDAHARASAEKLSIGDAVEELAKLRAGEQAAADNLKKGLAYLIYEAAFEWAKGSGKRRIDDIIGSLFLGLNRALKRIAENDAADPVAFVKQELSRRVHKYRREVSRRINPKPQTNAYRRREGLPLYKGLSRVECVPHDDVDINPLEQAAYQGPELHDEYHAYRGPSKHYNWADDVNMVDLVDEFEHDPDLLTTAELTLAGHTIEDITSTTHLTEYRVGQHRKEIVKRLGAEKSDTTAANVELSQADEALHRPAELELSLAV
jgi:hypothetical protein